MVRIDGRKIQEVKDNFDQQAEFEIRAAEADGVELKEDDIIAIKNKHTYKCTEALYNILSSGPQKLFTHGFTLDPNGWREGYTKAPLKKRIEKRRKQNKLARATRQAQRKNK